LKGSPKITQICILGLKKYHLATLDQRAFGKNAIERLTSLSAALIYVMVGKYVLA
jgi:hypothetical protein